MDFRFIWLALEYPIAMFFIVAMISHKTPRRKHFLIKSIACVIFILALAFGWNVLTKFVILDTWILWRLWNASQCFIYFILIIFAVWLCFECDIWTAMFICTAGYCLQHISFNIFSIIQMYFRPLVSDIIWADNLILYGSTCLIYAGVIVLFYYMIIKRVLRRNGQISVDNKMQVLISTLVLTAAVYLYFFGAAAARSYGANDSLVFIRSFAILACVLSLFVEFGLYANKTIAYERDVAKQLLHDEREQYLKEKATFDIINIKSHDLKHQISAIESKLDKSELAEITKSVEIYDSAVKTGNDALDVVLTSKSLLCQSENIHMTRMLDGKQISFMTDSDIYSLFGNALDNAIEAVSELPEDKRYINVQIKTKGHNIFIHVENFYEKNIIFRDGLPQTTKYNKKFHGFGTKSIKSIVEKYNGTVVMKSENGLFTLNAIIPK